jgi:hypothetical protein
MAGVEREEKEKRGDVGRPYFWSFPGDGGRSGFALFFFRLQERVSKSNYHLQRSFTFTLYSHLLPRYGKTRWISVTPSVRRSVVARLLWVLSFLLAPSSNLRRREFQKWPTPSAPPFLCFLFRGRGVFSGFFRNE